MPENAAAEGGFGRDAPDRSRDTDNNRGGAREDKESRAEKAESFDRAMDNANRPDRAPAAPAETATASDDDDDDNKNDKTEDQPDHAAGPSGTDTAQSTPSPTDTAEESDEDDQRDERGLLDRVADALTAPPTDADGNARSTSPVADRVGSHTVNYSLDDVFGPPELEDMGLTPEQSATLAQSAAVMNGYAMAPAIPSTADLVLDDILPGTPGPLSATPISQSPAEERDWADYMADGGAYGAGLVVGAGERAVDLASELPGAALEAVSMVNDAAGTVFDTAVGWTGIDLFEGHAERNVARGRAMFDGVVGLPDQIAEGWDGFTGNIAAGNYYDAGRQTGNLAFDVAGIAVPASKVATLGKVDDVVPNTSAMRASTPELDRVRREIDEAGAAVFTDADPDVRDYMDNAARRQGLNPNELPAVTIGDNIMVRDSYKDDIVTLSEELEHVRQQQDGRVAVGADGYDTRIDLEVEARENMLRNDNLSLVERDQIQYEINTIRDRGYY